MFAYYETSGKKNIQIKTPDTLFQGQLLSELIKKQFTLEMSYIRHRNKFYSS